MTGTRWSVRLALENREPSAIYKQVVGLVDRDVRQLGIGNDPDVDDPPSLTFELEAASPNDARVRAQHKLGEIRRRAGLSVNEAPIIWVAKLDDGQNADSLRFLEQAHEALRSEQPELAVVAAQIHLEVQVRVLLQRVAETRDNPVLSAVAAGQRRWAPDERWLQPVLEAIYNVKFEECPWWADYKAHHTRRNAVVHAGQEIDEVAARESIRAVSGLWDWLNRRANKLS